MSTERNADDKDPDNSNIPTVHFTSVGTPRQVAGGCAVLLLLVIAAIGLIWACTALTGESDEERASRIAAENRACLRDVDCLVDKVQWQLAGGRACERLVENQARYSARWTDGWAESKFPRVGLQPPDYKTIRLLGDGVEFQNGFGAWQRMRYACEYDPINEIAIDVQVVPFN